MIAGNNKDIMADHIAELVDSLIDFREAIYEGEASSHNLDLIIEDIKRFKSNFSEDLINDRYNN